MKRRMKTVSLLAAMWMAATLGSVTPVQAEEAPREDATKACLAAAPVRQSAAVSVGYCTVDCSPCTLKTTDCQRRGAGSCSPVQACRQPAPQ